jgi:hypothetical protein
MLRWFVFSVLNAMAVLAEGQGLRALGALELSESARSLLFRLASWSMLVVASPQKLGLATWSALPVRWREGVRRTLEHSLRSRWLPGTLTAVSLVGAYLRFQQAGLTPLFWIFLIVGLCGASIGGWRLARRTLRLRDSQRIRRLVESPEVKIPVVEALIGTYSAALKASSLSSRLAASNLRPRIIAFLDIEGQLGAILNIGANEAMEVGTPLLVYRVDAEAERDVNVVGGLVVESILCSLTVSYVQVTSNLAQALVRQQLGDRGYWATVRKELRQQRRVTPPRNMVVPHTPQEIVGLSTESLKSIITHLDQVRRSLMVSVRPFPFQAVEDGDD